LTRWITGIGITYETNGSGSECKQSKWGCSYPSKVSFQRPIVVESIWVLRPDVLKLTLKIYQDILLTFFIIN
jgi:hypothetical protein